MENSLDNKYKKFLGVSNVELQKRERERSILHLSYNIYYIYISI